MKTLIFGSILTVISWILAWGRVEPFYEYSFFPLWIGYIITINGLSYWLFGRSLLSRMGKSFLILFLISIPLWWFFEFLNLFTHNWHYIFPRQIGQFEYFVRASISFSTVIPAVLSTAFLFYNILARIKHLRWVKFPLSQPALFTIFGLGVLSFLLIFVTPYLSFPFMWLGLFLMFEPLNYSLKFSSILREVNRGKYTLFVAIGVATLFTGFWWEMWNFYSLPKWTYLIPYVGYFKIFEMPILGFLGYPFFGLEVYSFTNFMFGVLRKVFKLEFLKLSLA